ncbi:hypothetical protein PMIN03_011627 [Paraphaeosphaeria minitans]
MTQITLESLFTHAIHVVTTFSNDPVTQKEHFDICAQGFDIVNSLHQLSKKEAGGHLPAEITEGVEQIGRVWQYFLDHNQASKVILLRSARNSNLMLKVLSQIPE